MKKLLVILFTLAMILTLASCDEKKDKSEGKNDAELENEIEDVLGDIEQLPNDHESIVEDMGTGVRNYTGLVSGSDAVLAIKDGAIVLSVEFTSGDSIDGLEYEAVVSNTYFGSAVSEKDGRLEVRFVKGRTSAVLSGEGAEAFKADAISGITAQEGEECGRLCEGYFNGETVTLTPDSPHFRFFLGDFVPKVGNLTFILTEGEESGGFEVVKEEDGGEDYDPGEENEELEYYPSGNVKLSKVYDDNGELMYYTEYYDAEDESIKLYRHYYEGRLQSEEGYDINGEQTLRAHYHEDGSLHFREERLEDGSEEYEEYDEFGNPVGKNRLNADGSRWSIMYGADGKKAEENYFNSNDVLIRGVRYNEEGKLYFDEYFDDDGNRTKRHNYDSNGVLESTATYFKNGEMKSDIQYRGDRVLYEGEWYENGELKMEKYYFSNGKLQRHLEFYENGKQSLYVENEESGKLKMKEEYYENGNPKYSYMIWPRYGVENSECETWYYENGETKKDHTKFPDGGQRIDEYYEDGTQKYHYYEYEDGSNYEYYYDENGNQIN